MIRGQKEFITQIFTDASNFRGIQVSDEEDCLGRIIERVQYLPNLENSTLSDVSEDFIRLPFSVVTRDFSIVQLMLVTSTQSVSFEPKFHDNYLAFLDKVGLDSLYKEVLLTTCVISKALLCPEILSHPTLNQVPPGLTLPSSEFLIFVLKNLGAWLGKLVVSTNSSLSKTDIDLKSLIVEAYKLGLMSKTIPFVLKFLEPCSKSPLYTHSDHTSYVMVILRLLSEIYSMPGLQTTLVSSIEDLFDTFGVMGPIQPTSFLANLSKKEDDNPDFVDNESCITDGKHDQQLSTLIDKIKNVVIFSSRTHPRLACLPDSLSVVQLAVSKAIGIVVPHLVKMSVDVALYSTKAHVLMTYPLGADDNLRNNAASMMALSLAQRYAKKLCKEPLRGWMYSLLHGSIQHPRISYDARCQIVDSIIRDNLQTIYMGIQEMARTEVERDIQAQVQMWIRPGNDNNSNEVIKEKMEAGISVNEMKELLDSNFVFVGDKYEALLEAIFSGVEKGFAKVLEEKKMYLTAVMEPTSQCFFLQAIENYFIKGTSEAFKEELPMVFEYLHTAPDLADGEDLTYFLKKIQDDTEASTSIRQSVKNLLSRLQGAAVQDRVPYIV